MKIKSFPAMQLETKIKYAALAVFMITAWFSLGHHHSDEHFQILEFAQYKLGLIDAGDLPWEFHEKMRPSLQAWFAFVFIKIIHFIGVTNPFVITAILRIFSALLLWMVIGKLNKIIGEKYFPDKKWAILFYACSYLLWFVPYISVRFSSENYAHLFLLMGLYFILKENKGLQNLVGIGVFLGLSVLFRYQMGIAVMGIFLWLIFKASVPFPKLVFIFIAFVAIIPFGVYLDYLFYNEFVLTAFNYIQLNLFEGKASGFGTSPLWYYLVTFLGIAIPPISIVLLASFLLGVKKLRNDAFTWGIVPFILVHFLIAHKEMRFLFPVSYLFIFISIYGLMEFFKNRSIKRFHRRLLRVSIGINAVLLLFMMLRPANEMVANYKYLYDNIDLRKRTILTIEKDNYSLMAGLKSTFYKPDSCITYVLGSEESLRSYLQENQIDTCFFVYGKYEFKGIVEGYTTEKVYSVYPDWLKTIHWVDWQKTLKTHSIYLVALKKNSDNFHQ